MFKNTIRHTAIIALAIPVGYAIGGEAEPVRAVPASSGVDPEEVLVTGSRLPRNVFDAPAPIVDVPQEALLERGATDIAEALTDMPGVDLAGSLSNNQNSITDNGLSTISLRGLGANRTLTLIDGRRTVSNSGTGNVVSLSTIPEFFVERVEVMTGGASAVYGSDAISGVVNLITLNKFEGVKVRAGGGAATEGGAETLETSLLAGTMLADDRLSLLVGGSYRKDYGLKATERDYATRSVRFDPVTNTLTQPDLSTSIPGGRFLSRFFYDEDGLHDGYDPLQDGYDVREATTLVTPRESASAALKATFALTPSARLWATAIGSWVTTRSEREPDNFTSTSTYGSLGQLRLRPIARTNPFVPAEIAAAAPASGISFQRRASELGNRTRFNQRDTYRAWLGADGNFLNDWTWNVAYGYGQSEGRQERDGGINMPNVALALDAERLPDGTIRCRDAVARANGCVPLNIFGVGSITPEAAQYIGALAVWDYRNEQQTLSGYVTGSPVELPAGALQTVFGFELREDTTRSVVDPINAAGLTSVSAIPEYSGEVRVKEAYTEVSVPLLADKSFVHRLTLDGALRVADYSLDNVGTIFSSRIGGQWSPIPSVRLRAAFSRALRAPDLTELNSPAMDDADNVVDPCSGVTASTSGTLADNCRANPGIAAAIAAEGVFIQEAPGINGPSSGNPDLKEEAADTFTLGVVINPLPRLVASVDYYDIKISDAIGELTNETILGECYVNATDANNRFCGLVTRDPGGQITRILNQSENLNEMRVAGVDFAVRYGLGDPAATSGDFSIGLNITRRLKAEQKIQVVDGEQLVSFLGELNNPKLQARASLDWTYRKFSADWTTVYIGEAVDSNERKSFFAENGVTEPLVLNIDAHVRHDLSLTFTPTIGKVEMRFFGTLRDVFDADVPFLPAGSISNRVYNTNAIYGLQGRSVSVGVQLQF
ncbi:MAG: TonB-dependent receptor plug domain-containing protein [Steroidobacteraceae bacterium]